MQNILKPPRIKKSWHLLVGFIGFLFLLSLVRPLSYPDEGRYAEIGRWMLQSGDWLTPRLNGMPFFHKPPLLYWMEAIFYAALGAHPWVARLAPELHACLMLLGVYSVARHFGTTVLANRAVAMLGSSLAFLAGGQYVNHDLMVATWISIAIGSFAMAFMAGDRPDRRLAWLGFVACGLGVLSKGLIGIVLPGMVLLIWLVWTRQLKKIIYMPWLSGLALLCFIAIPWFALEEQRFPGMLNYMFGLHHFQRFTGSGFNNNQAWWFYLVALVIMFFPWVFFSFANLAKIRKTPVVTAQANQLENRSFSAPIISLCWIWVIFIVGFFTLPTAKVVGYVLPVIPPLALLAAVGWQLMMGHLKRERPYFVALCGMNVVLALGLTVTMGVNTTKKSALEVGKTYACLAKTGAKLYLLDGFPYDLPFALSARQPLIVVQDWEALRRTTSDNWHSELIDAAAFDATGMQILQNKSQLDLARTQPNSWVIASVGSNHSELEGWVEIQETKEWDLYQSNPTNAGVTQDALIAAATATKCLQ